MFNDSNAHRNPGPVGVHGSRCLGFFHYRIRNVAGWLVGWPADLPVSHGGQTDIYHVSLPRALLIGYTLSHSRISNL
jgi:hypothetical protein